LLSGGSIDNKRNDIDGQICLYKRGVGGVSENELFANMNFVKGDLSQQTGPMREMLEKVYEKGDKLYIVGFSRGSSSARKFVCLLDEFGLKTASGETVEKPPVEFLGCFETVSNQVKNIRKVLRNRRRGTITKPSVLGEIDGKLSPIVGTAVHNVALDDNRCFVFPPFPPVFMDSNDSRVHEAWFPGEHGDIGGTYYVKGIPDGSLKSMQEWMESLGLKFLEKGEDIHPDCLKINVKGYEDVHIDRTAMDIIPNSADKLHLLGKQLTDPSHRPVVAITNEAIIEGATIRIHKSVFEHMEAMEQKNTPYDINPEIYKCTDIIVVGSLDTKLVDETKKFKEILGKSKAS